jgi:hypothetical protein
MMETANPRFLPGSISGQAMTHDDNGRKVDTRYGIVVTGTDGCLIEHPVAGEITIAYAIDGVVDETPDRVRGLFLLPPAVAAQMIGDLAGMLLRADPVAAAAMVGRLADIVSPPSPPEQETQPLAADVPVASEPGEGLAAA